MSALLVILGSAVLASLCSMLIWRLNNNISLFKPLFSVCPQCRKRLQPQNLIPIFSYLIQQGRCSYCHKPIPRTYFFLELLSVSLGLASYYAGLPLLTILLNLLLLAALFSDLLYRQIPYTFLISAGALIIVPNYRQLLQTWPNLLFVIALWGFIKLLEKLVYKREAFGGADYILFACFALGLPRDSFVLLLYLSFLIAFGFAILGILLHKLTRQSYLPFVPFIVIAYYILTFWGPQLLQLLKRIYYV